ncbi:hypothetical protein N9N67_05155 [Bacteriovoracaceae bacterium]|nr:hypothetical protein [Bacteriovoracaceae bacterium]
MKLYLFILLILSPIFLTFGSELFEQKRVSLLLEEVDVSETNDYYYSNGVPFAGKEYESVTKQHGILKIKKELVDGKIRTYEGDVKPWSSWWWPSFQKNLFSSGTSTNNSPLGKYDRYYKKRFRVDPKTAFFEEKNLYNPRSVEWAGLCYPWSIVSLIVPEPNKSRIIRKIKFDVKDQKALILKSYELIEKGVKMYGVRNNSDWDDIFADIYPEQFHRFIQVYLQDKKQSFVMDTDPKYPVWNVPVYKVQFKIIKEGNNLSVKAWVFTASPHVDDPNYVGTYIVTKTYTYQLNITKEAGEYYHIGKGQWTDRSRWDHPDYLLIVDPEKMVHRSLNPKVKNEVVRDILGL